MHQPLEYVYVAVHADVDVIAAVAARDVRPEIGHLSDENILAAHEVLFNMAHLVGDVNHDGGVRARRLQVVRVLRCGTLLLRDGRGWICQAA